MNKLTRREEQVLQLLCEGAVTSTIAAILKLSPRTVDIHRQNAISRMGARNSTHAAVLYDRYVRQGDDA